MSLTLIILGSLGIAVVAFFAGPARVSVALVNIGAFILPGIAGYKGYSLWILVVWSFVFSVVTSSPVFRAFAGMQTPPDVTGIKYSAMVLRWVWCVALMLVAYGLGWAMQRVL